MAKTLEKNLRLIRIRRGYTQQELAGLAGLHRNSVARIELGGANVTQSTLSALAKALRVTVFELLGGGR